MKRTIVVGLDWLCAKLDNMPWILRDFDGKWRFYRRSCIGCYPLQLAELSYRLDEKWNTHVWIKEEQNGE